MSVSHVLSLNYTRSGEQIAKNVTLSADGEDNRSVTLTAAQADKQVLFPLTTASLVSLYISSDVDITVESNASSGTSVTDTLTITAGKPYVWYQGCGLAAPLSANIGTNGIYLTNGNTSSSGTVEIRSLKDSTP